MNNDELEVRLRTMLRQRASDVRTADVRPAIARLADVPAYEPDPSFELTPGSPPATERRRQNMSVAAVAAAILLVVGIGFVVVRRDLGSPAANGGAVRGTALKTASDGNAECVHASATPQSWDAMRAGEVAFGVNDVMLATRDTTVVVTSVVPQGVTGSVTVGHAAFIPIAGVGTDYPWSDVGKHSAAPWSLHRDVPTTLSYEPRYTEIRNVPPGYDGSTFQLVVGITTGPEGGRADHMRVFYTASNHAYYVDVYTSVAMYPTPAECVAAVNPSVSTH